MTAEIRTDDLVVCECAGCRRMLLGDRMRVLPDAVLEAVCRQKWGRTPPFVASRVRGRPYCGSCMVDVLHENPELVRRAWKPAEIAGRAVACVCRRMQVTRDELMDRSGCGRRITSCRAILAHVLIGHGFTAADTADAMACRPHNVVNWIRRRPRRTVEIEIQDVLRMMEESHE